MNLALSDLLDKFLAVIWPMLRLSAFLAFTTIFPSRSVSLRIRIALALVLAYCVTLQLNIPRIDPLTAPGLQEVFRQILIGFTLAMVTQVVTAALVLAGQAITNAMGLGIASLIDPGMGNVPVLSQFFNLLGVLMLLGMGGHLIVFGLVLESFRLLPIGQPFFHPDMLGRMLHWSAMMFLGALLLALPMLMTLLFINLGLGFVARAAPSLNLFTVGFPALILMGFGVLVLAMDHNVARITWIWTQAFVALREFLGG